MCVFLQDWPEKKAKLVVDIAANPKMHEALANLQKETTVEKVNIKMPDIDLSKHMHEGKDVVSHTGYLVCFFEPEAACSCLRVVSFPGPGWVGGGGVRSVCRP